MERFYLKGYCNASRHAGISKIEDIINEYGFITDFKFFSDISVSMLLEIQKCKLDSLLIALNDYLDMDDFKKTDSSSSEECMIFLNITFKQSTGDLEIGIPNIPG